MDGSRFSSRSHGCCPTENKSVYRDGMPKSMQTRQPYTFIFLLNMHYALHHRLVPEEFLRYVVLFFSEQPFNIFCMGLPYVQRKWQNISRHATMSNEGGVQIASEQQFSGALKRSEPESSGEEVITTPQEIVSCSLVLFWR